LCLSHLIYTVRPCLIHTCHAVLLRFRLCLSHLIYTVMPCLIHTYHTVTMPCRSAKGLDCIFPFDLHSAAVFDSHIPCQSSAMLQSFRSKSDLLRQRQGRSREPAWERHSMCELALENGRVVVEERHGSGMVCVKPP
jgi:hypothetical protein